MTQQRIDRRLAAIVAADVAGYSRLMGADEAGTARRLREHVAAISATASEFGGRVVKITGDQVLFEFPSIVAAVECAIKVQGVVEQRNRGVPDASRMLFRIGINLGDVLIEGDDILGDGVNVASRLEGIAEPGGICVSRAVYEQCVGRVTVAFKDMGQQQLKNIAAPVHVFAVATETSSTSRQASPTLVSPAARAPRLSIVVLPFVNLGSDPEHGHFADSITESLTTDLLHIPDAFVIARHTASVYKGKPIDARRIGGELGVRYVIEGSVQAVGGRIRINAQLIDTESGAHLWAERFDKERADLFATQDEVSARLARAIEIKVVAAESRRAERERPDNPEAADLVMRGRAVWHKTFSLPEAREARGLFEAALRLDERHVAALVGFAEANLWEVNMLTSDDRDGQIRAAATAMSRALALAPDSARVRFSHGTLLLAQRVPDRALREYQRAADLNPNYAVAHAQLGLIKLCLGRAGETEAHVAEAMRLSPRDPLLFQWHMFIGVADLYLGKVVRSLQALRKSVELNGNWGLSYIFLTAALALAGLYAEAAEAGTTARRLSPKLSIAKFRAETVGENRVYLAQRERVYEGLRAAGIPEAIDEPTPVVAAAPGSKPGSAETLSYSDFVAAARSALRDFNRPDLLARNPLLRARLLATHENAGPAELQALLLRTAQTLFANARDEKLHRALDLTYFHPAPKQEAAADRIGVAFGTYRRHLTTALNRLTTWLWDLERGTSS